MSTDEPGLRFTTQLDGMYVYAYAKTVLLAHWLTAFGDIMQSHKCKLVVWKCN